MAFADRVQKISEVAQRIQETKAAIVEATVQDVGFARKDAAREIDLVTERLQSSGEVAPLLAGRRPLCREEEAVALLLPYDGNTWMNTAILSIWLPGNRVRVKFSSKGARLARLTEELYRPIFGDDVQFEHRGAGSSWKHVCPIRGSPPSASLEPIGTSCPTPRPSARAGRN